MQRITFVPGAVATPNPITIPTNVPRMAAVVAAQIVRVPSAVTIPADTSGTTEVAEINGAGHLAVGAGGGLEPADPVVAAVPTMVDEDTITLDVNTELGDILTLDYIEVGARVPVS